MKLSLNTFGIILSTAILSLSTPILTNAQTLVSDEHAQNQAIHSADAGLPWVQGKVVKISKKRGVVTIAHGEISNLSMPSMTMGFKADDKTVLDDLAAGDVIEFQTVDKGGKLILLHVRRPNS